MELSTVLQKARNIVDLGFSNLRVFYHVGDGNDVVLAHQTPTEVFVDDDWASLSIDGFIADANSQQNGQQPAILGWNAFATIQAAINGVAIGGTVWVNAGQYEENLDINKRLTLDGSGSGSDAAHDTVILVSATGISINADGVSDAVLTLEDLHLSAVDGSSDHGVMGVNHHFVALTNVIVEHFGLSGVFFADCSDLALTNVASNRNGQSPAADPGFGSGIQLASVRQAVLTNVTATGNFDSGLLVTAGVGGDATGITIDGGSFVHGTPTTDRSDGTNGLNFFVDPAGGIISNVIIEGAVNIQHQTFGGITLFNPGLGSITDVAIGQLPGDAIDLTDNRAGLMILGNVSHVQVMQISPPCSLTLTQLARLCWASTAPAFFHRAIYGWMAVISTVITATHPLVWHQRLPWRRPRSRRMAWETCSAHTPLAR